MCVQAPPHCAYTSRGGKPTRTCSVFYNGLRTISFKLPKQIKVLMLHSSGYSRRQNRIRSLRRDYVFDVRSIPTVEETHRELNNSRWSLNTRKVQVNEHLRKSADLVWCCISAFWATCKFQHSLAQFDRSNASWIVFAEQRFTSDFFILIEKNSRSECSELLQMLCGFSELTLHLLVCRIRGVHDKRLLIPRACCRLEEDNNEQPSCVFEFLYFLL